jgi:hypothetical protein
MLRAPASAPGSPEEFLSRDEALEESVKQGISAGRYQLPDQGAELKRLMGKRVHLNAQRDRELLLQEVVSFPDTGRAQ